jgi:hypothetical protein
MRFEVPQFIDIEDKIFGPLTFKQFIYLLGGGALSYISFKLIPSPFWIIFVAAFAGMGLALAFYKINNRNFLEIITSYIAFQFKGKIYIWKRALASSVPKREVPKPVEKVPEKIFNEDTVTDLAQNLDILDH